MKKLKHYIDKARHSKVYLWLLNAGLSRFIPFNRPHGIKVVNIEQHKIKTLLPFRKPNLNHIKGLHACALATLSEFTTGLLLIYNLDPAKYRLILKHLDITYVYQGKSDAYAEFSIDAQWLNEKVVQPLESSPAVFVLTEVKIHDSTGNHLTTAKVEWQIKSWSKVAVK
ncbi:MAG: DUF4442 domain-containing protein [Cyclobacteriaceae bacterium]